MIILIIILGIAIVYWMLFSGKTENKKIVFEQAQSKINSETKVKETETIFTDEHGKFKIVKKQRELPRKTYIIGLLHGKYWGEIDPDKDNEYSHSKFYNFHIYEARVFDTVLSLTEFDFVSDSRFPKDRLPPILPTVIKNNGKEYSVNVHDPSIGHVSLNSKLHQSEGLEVFGTIEARLTGYLLDFIKEEYTDKEYLPEVFKSTPIRTTEGLKLSKTDVPTGNVEYKNGYKRNEYYYSDYKSKYWGDWKYQKNKSTSRGIGCLSFTLSTLGIIVGIAFLILSFPKLVILIPFILLPYLFGIIPEKIWLWISRTFGVLLAVSIIISFISHFINGKQTYLPKPVATDTREESEPKYNPVSDTINNTHTLDTLITHFRTWRDYDGRTYEGMFWIKKSDWVSASKFKRSIPILDNTQADYDEIIYHLKEHDKERLQGLYTLFDSLKIGNSLDTKGFVEMVVSFVQDIPYSLVLPFACDPQIYADKFIRSYLSAKEALCDDFEKFGLNSPVEFMASLRGDCDTRTVLIYTILSHYNYDVAVLSSEYFNHSIIGINLPYDGISYNYNSQKYVLWETTAPNIAPGILPKEISNLNYWRISLKSK